MMATETIRFTGKERDAETGLDYFGAALVDRNVGGGRRLYTTNSSSTRF